MHEVSAMRRRIGGPARPPVEPFPPIDDSEWENDAPQVGSISQLTEKPVRGKTRERKHPLGFYENQTKEKTDGDSRAAS